MVGMAESVPVSVALEFNGTMPALPECGETVQPLEPRQRAHRQNLPKSRGLYAVDQTPHKAPQRQAPRQTPLAMTSEAQSRPRVVIDTNVLLDWLVFREPAALVLGQAIQARQWMWCTTGPMLDELRLVLARPLPERWQPAQKLALTIDVRGLDPTVHAPPALAPRDVPICRDPADQMFIDLALHCRPCWLLTHDRALLALRRRAAALSVVIAPPLVWQRQHAPTPAATADTTT
jgi:putative PIN family toxin of toxin-antitoxin system